MLSPNNLEYISDDIKELYSNLNNKIIKDISRRLINAGTMTESARWQIKIAEESGLVYDNIIKLVSENMKVSEREVRDIFEEASIESLEYDNEIYRKAGINPISRQSETMLNILDAGLQKTNNLIHNLCLTTASSGQDEFIKICDEVYQDVITGAFDYNTAIFNGIEKMAQNGLYVYYPSGYKKKIDVAIRDNVRTGITQTVGEMQRQRASELGNDLMEITAHEGARPEHEIWQGKVVSLSGKTKRLSNGERVLTLKEIGYGSVKGFKGINCRHDWYPFFDGISERAYDLKELQELNNQTVIYNNQEIKIYDARQIQRGVERNVRELKRQLAAYSGILTSDTDNLELIEEAQSRFAQKSIELKEKENLLAEFSEQTGLKRDRAKERINRFDKKISQKVNWSSKNSTKSNKDDILFTEVEKNQLKEYTRFDATRINKAIRQNKINEQIEYKMKILDSAINKAKPLEKDIILHRGTIIQSISGFENRNKVTYEEIMNLRFKKIRDKAYISTSKCKAEELGREIIMKVKVPKGFKGALDIEKYAVPKYKYQKEVLLPRNTIFFVKDIQYNDKNKKYYFEMEVLDEKDKKTKASE